MEELKQIEKSDKVKYFARKNAVFLIQLTTSVAALALAEMWHRRAKTYGIALEALQLEYLKCLARGENQEDGS